MSDRRPSPQHVNRRDFVRVTAASAGVVAAGGLSLLAACKDDTSLIEPRPRLANNGKGGGGGGGKGGGGPSTRNPLNIPSEVRDPSNYTLRAEPGQTSLGGGVTSNAWMYNGEFPGPTLRAGSGTNVSMELDNGLADQSTIHWHGMIVPHDMDGHPEDFVLPGDTRPYAYQINQRAAMNWYHPHPHGLTGEQVHLGLAGAFIIEDSEEAGLGLPQGRFEVPLIIRDAKLDSSGNMQYKASRNGYEGNLALVNGTLDATLDVEPNLYRFRMLNGSNARNYRLSLSDGSPLTVIGNDGGFLPAAAPCSEITFAPAERLDILIDFKDMQGASIMLQDLDAGWDLLEFVVLNGGNAGRTISSYTLPSLPTGLPTEGQSLRTRDFSFDGMNRINGRTYAVDRIDETINQGDVEVWRFTTNGNAPHPVHVHIEAFQVLRRSGGRNMVMPWEAGLKDTVLLEDGETVEVLVQFNQYKGVYLMHCHKLEHEDIGMMLNFEVI